MYGRIRRGRGKVEVWLWGCGDTQPTCDTVTQSVKIGNGGREGAILASGKAARVIREKTPGGAGRGMVVASTTVFIQLFIPSPVLWYIP